MVDTKLYAIETANRQQNAPAGYKNGGGGSLGVQNKSTVHPHAQASADALHAGAHPLTLPNAVHAQRLDTQPRRVGASGGALVGEVPRGIMPVPIPAYAPGVHAPIAHPGIPAARDAKGTYNHIALNQQEAAK
jgi:hypothetical protein